MSLPNRNIYETLKFMLIQVVTGNTITMLKYLEINGLGCTKFKS